MFHPEADKEGEAWSAEDDHLAKMLEMTGETFPPEMQQRARLWNDYFDANGTSPRHFCRDYLPLTYAPRKPPPYSRSLPSVYRSRVKKLRGSSGRRGRTRSELYPSLLPIKPSRPSVCARPRDARVARWSIHMLIIPRLLQAPSLPAITQENHRRIAYLGFIRISFRIHIHVRTLDCNTLNDFVIVIGFRRFQQVTDNWSSASTQQIRFTQTLKACANSKDGKHNTYQRYTLVYSSLSRAEESINKAVGTREFKTKYHGVKAVGEETVPRSQCTIGRRLR